jgi:tyrosyl-tRNA synthetase
MQKLLTRGVAQILPDKKSLVKRLKEKPLKLYLGIDPTGSFLHLGHSIALRKLQQFAQAGHEAILLIGNGTVKIGDPSGKDTSRPTLTDSQIEANFATWKKQASKILDFTKIKILHNGEWLDKLRYADLVKLMSKTTVQQLLERDMFQKRLKQNLPIFGHEIIYPLIQGYDSVAMNVDLEIGGSDQMFNMMMGRQLQKIYHGREKWVMTMPIVNGPDGRKMSKSFNNYIALTEEAGQMYAKTMTLADNLILEYFELLTDVSVKEIKEMKMAMATGENPMVFKKLLAQTLVTMYHHQAAAEKAAAKWQAEVSEKKVPQNLTVIAVPNLKKPLFELVKRARPKTSNSDLRRLVNQGGVELLAGGVLRVGKKEYYQLVEEKAAGKKYQ